MVTFTDTEPHALLVLLAIGADPQCLHVWRDEAPASPLHPGDLIPLPDEAIAAAGGNVEQAGEVERVVYRGAVLEDVRALLPEAPAAGCACVIVLRALAPEATEDGFVLLGGFEPADARRLLELLEEHEVPFEVESDHSQLLQPGRAVPLYLGMIPAGSCMRIFVHQDSLAHVRKLLDWLYPPEKPAPARARAASGPPGTGSPAMEIYATPQSEIAWEVRRDFYIRPRDKTDAPAPDAWRRHERRRDANPRAAMSQSPDAIEPRGLC